MHRALTAVFALSAACAHAPTPASVSPPISAEEAREKLAKMSKNKVQLWVVVHIRAHKTLNEDGTINEEKLTADALTNADAVVNGGGDMIILINARAPMDVYQRIITKVRAKHPTFPLGISVLDYGPSGIDGITAKAYGPANLTSGFQLAKKFDAQMVWCEVVPDERIEFETSDKGYLEAPVIPLALAVETRAKTKPDVFHTGGVHMKYTRPLDGLSFEEAMARALGKVDGINITGPRTGVLADVERVRAARAVAGDFPLGLASGVSVDNITAVVPFIDYAIVGTSLKDDNDPLMTNEDKVRALRAKIDEHGGGPRS